MNETDILALQARIDQLEKQLSELIRMINTLYSQAGWTREGTRAWVWPSLCSLNHYSPFGKDM